jgi:ATP-dependent Clp protease ATP-binding subunit ClpC
MGARPLRRAIQRYIEDQLADFVLRQELTPQATVVVDVAPENDDREVILSIVEPKVPAAVGVGAGAAEADGAAAGADHSEDGPAEPGGALDTPATERESD